MVSPGSEILDYLREQRESFVYLLEMLTVCESPSGVPDGLETVRSIIGEALESIDYRVTDVRGNTAHGHLFARPRDNNRKHPYQLLLGHYDTVWPMGTLGTMPFRVQGEIARGPGVYDMKGGVAQIIFALQAIHHLNIKTNVTPVVFLNSDEEIGSRDSYRWIENLAPLMNRVMVMEPSLGPHGKLKTSRKGVGRFKIKVKGKAAHAGLDPEAGVSAILEMSHVIQTLFALNDVEKGITVNVGTVDGGLRPNVIAPESSAIIDVRVRTMVDAEHVETAIKELQPTIDGVQVEIEGRVGRPPMEPTERNLALWHMARDLGKAIDLDLEDGAAGGGSDGNFTSLHTATLDGLGAVGEGAHAAHEAMNIDRSLERAALLALLMQAPALEMMEKAA